MDVRTVEAGDTAPGGGTIEIEPAIEIGNIFKLGTPLLEPLGATYLGRGRREEADRDGQLRDRPGPDRRRDDRAGRRTSAESSGRRRLAPWQIHLVSLAKAGEPGARGRRPPLRSCVEAGAEVLYDEREAGTGQKLTNAGLLGCRCG